MARNKVPGMSLQVQLDPRWKKILKRAWSFRMVVATSFFCTLELAVLSFGEGWFPPRLFLGAAMITSLLAGIFRVMPQVNLSGDE